MGAPKHFILMVHKYDPLYLQLCKDPSIQGLHILDFGCVTEDANLYSATATTYSRIHPDLQNPQSIFSSCPIKWKSSDVYVLNLIKEDWDKDLGSPDTLFKSLDLHQGILCYPVRSNCSPLDFNYLISKKIEYNTLKHFVWGES